MARKHNHNSVTRPRLYSASLKRSAEGSPPQPTICRNESVKGLLNPHKAFVFTSRTKQNPEAP